MKPELNTEVANRLRDPYENLFNGVIRTNDPLLLERSQGGQAVELYRDLKRDGKVFSSLQKRKLALISRPWTVDPIEDGEAGQRDAAVVLAMLKSVSFDKLCAELLDALLVGFVPAEVVWTVRDGRVTPERIVQRAQRRFVYVQTDPHGAPELRLLTQANMLTGEVLPPAKFIVHRVNPEDDNPYGTGLGLQLYWPVFFKRKGILSWNKLNDRFGSPTPWGKYPKNSGPKEKGTLFDALKAMSNDGVMMTPEGMSIELLESKLTGSISTQKDLCHYMDGWIQEVILSQEQGRSTGATASAANEREDVRLDLVQADADLLSDTLNSTLIKWFCEFNGLAACQVSRVIKKPEDLKAASETDVNVASLGFKPTLEAIRAKYGEGWEDAPVPPPAPIALPAAVPLPPLGEGRDGGKPAPNFAEAATRLNSPLPPLGEGRDGGDPVAVDTNTLMRSTAPAWAAMLGQIESLVNDATSLPELQNAMVQAYGNLDNTELVKLMAAALALAELKGMDAVRREALPATNFAEPVPVVNNDLSLSIAALATATAALAARDNPAPLVQVTNQVQPTPVQVDVNNQFSVPEQAAPVVQVTVQPAPVTVNNAFPSSAEQTVVRDEASDEIVKTVTTYSTAKP